MKVCPKCGKQLVVVNENESWECRHCFTGAYVYQCPGCGLWIVKEYDTGLPPAIECSGCGTIVST